MCRFAQPAWCGGQRVGVWECIISSCLSRGSGLDEAVGPVGRGPLPTEPFIGQFIINFFK